MAGGEVVLEHADAKHQTLSHHVEKLDGGEKINLELPWGRVLFVKAVPINFETKQRLWEKAIDLKDMIGSLQVDPVFQKAGLTTYTQKRFFTYRPKKVLNWTAPDGKWEIHCFLEVEIKDFKYYGTYVDPCHKEAMATFIRMTHERYAQTIGSHFGKVVKGMFTDETHLLGRYPWSPHLVDFVKQNYGYDMRDYLHLLVDHGCHFKTRNHEYKRSCHESSIRTPTAFIGPGFNQGGQKKELVNLIDLPTTLLDAAGIEVPKEMSGRPILPLVHGDKSDWKDEVFIQISESQVGRAIRTKRWKYSVSDPTKDRIHDSKSDHYIEEFLYDLEADPYELTNLIGMRSHQKVAEKLIERLLNKIEEIEKERPIIESVPLKSSGARKVTDQEVQS